MVNKNKSHTGTNLSKVIGCILAVLFIAWPCSAGVVIGELNVGSDYEVQQIDYPIVLGTLNLYPGAEVYSGILALSGCTINFYGGQMSQGSYVIAFSSTPNPEITVHGSNFAVNGQPCEPSATSFTLVPGRYNVLTGFYGNGDLINLTFYGNIPINLVTLDSGIVIDIKPGNEQNNINLNSKGVVPVAVLTTEQFDAATVNPATALFAGAEPQHWSFKDVDGDGDEDIIFHFRTQQLNLNQDSTEATLTAQLAGTPLMSQITTQSAAQTSGGTVVSGTDTVKIVAAKKSKK
jgi:hypothetical protein